MKKSLVFTALLAATPLAMLLPGCSGGSLPSNIFPTPTPKPNATATPNPSATTTATPTTTATTTATPRPTTTATTPPATGATVNLTFTPSSDSNFVQPGPLTGTLRFPTNNLPSCGVKSGSPNSANYLTFAVVARRDMAGGVVDLSDPGINFRAGTIIQASSGGVSKFFSPQSGTITLTALTATNATFTFNNARYAANSGSAARGSVTINGTVSGPFSP